jgi:hypothetical protein
MFYVEAEALSRLVLVFGFPFFRYSGTARRLYPPSKQPAVRYIRVCCLGGEGGGTEPVCSNTLPARPPPDAQKNYPPDKMVHCTHTATASSAAELCALHLPRRGSGHCGAIFFERGGGGWAGRMRLVLS